MRIRINPIYEPCATHAIIKGYCVYGYIGHVLLGEVQGTKRFFSSEKNAKRYMKELKGISK